MNDTIANSLNLDPLPTKMEIIDVNPNTTSNQDFEYARGNLISAIEKGQEALTDIVQIAGMTQSARSYEAIASILNAVTTANEKLLELSKKKKEIEASDGPSTINNNLFVGSTAELLKLIKTNNEKE
jgi:hypothetical protein